MTASAVALGSLPHGGLLVLAFLLVVVPMTLLTALAAALVWIGRRAWRSGAWLEVVPVAVGMPWLGRVIWLARAALVGRAFWRAGERASRPLRARRAYRRHRGHGYALYQRHPGWRMASGAGRRPQRHDQVAERGPGRLGPPPRPLPRPPGSSPPSPARVIRAGFGRAGELQPDRGGGRGRGGGVLRIGRLPGRAGPGGSGGQPVEQVVRVEGDGGLVALEARRPPPPPPAPGPRSAPRPPPGPGRR